MKKCSGCKQVKSVSSFNKNRITKDGLGWHCSTCRNKWYLKYKERLEKEPWRKTYKSIQNRCISKSNKYYKKGIKNFLTLANLEYMWFRDKAHFMVKPSIDRIYNSESYTFVNCRYIELAENSIKGNTIDRIGQVRRLRVRVRKCFICSRNYKSRSNNGKYCSEKCFRQRRLAKAIAKGKEIKCL